MSTNLESILLRLEEISLSFKELLEGLPNNDMNTVPGEGEWSIAQILDHLIIINSSYFPYFKKLKAGEFNPAWHGKIKLIRDFVGKTILKSVVPEATTKMKTPSVWHPTMTHIAPGILERFVDHQEELKNEFIDLNIHGLLGKETVIHSPANKNIYYSLDMALEIIVTHEERHLIQVERVLLEIHSDHSN